MYYLEKSIHFCTLETDDPASFNREATGGFQAINAVAPNTGDYLVIALEEGHMAQSRSNRITLNPNQVNELKAMLNNISFVEGGS